MKKRILFLIALVFLVSLLSPAGAAGKKLKKPKIIFHTENPVALCPFTIEVQPVENAETYVVTAGRVEKKTMYMCGRGESTEPRIDLEWEDHAIGGKYQFSVTVQAEGYESATASITLQVAEPERGEAPVITLSALEVNNQQPVSVTFDREYDKVRVHIEGNSWSPLPSDYTDKVDLGNLPVGEYDIYGYTLYNDIWSKPSEPQHIVVTQAPPLPELKIASVPGEVNQYESFTLEVEPVENAETYYASISYPDPQNKRKRNTICSGYTREPGETTISMHRWREKAEIPVKECELTVRAQAVGYEPSYVTVPIVVNYREWVEPTPKPTPVPTLPPIQIIDMTENPVAEGPFEVQLRPVENAVSYSASLSYHKSEKSWEEAARASGEEPSLSLKWNTKPYSGGDYELRITAALADGSQLQSETPLAIAEPDRAPAPVISLEKTEVLNTENTVILFDQVYDEYMIIIEDGSWIPLPQENGDHFEVTLGDVGNYDIIGYYRRNGAWSQPSEPVHITVNMGPSLPDPVIISAPQEVTEGEIFTIECEPIEGAERFYATVHFTVDEGGFENSWVLGGGFYPRGENPVISAEDWPTEYYSLAGRTVTVEVTAYSNGSLNPSGTTFELRVNPKE